MKKGYIHNHEYALSSTQNTTINKITLYADSSTYISTIYCATFHLFSTRLVLGFSVVQHFTLIRNSITKKRGQS